MSPHLPNNISRRPVLEIILEQLPFQAVVVGVTPAFEETEPVAAERVEPAEETAPNLGGHRHR